ncbi:hypothetical protein BJ742DRAFT_807071 [Cladochytrium replicatum]|nr:hypothetical protein BJ742DRAFT_807071 [Cladochytrium replicatum]
MSAPDDPPANGRSDSSSEAAENSTPDEDVAATGPTCSICLQLYDDKTVLDSCYHAFCFVCINQWAQVSRQCPLCKRPFLSAIHHILSDTNFAKYRFPPMPLKSGGTSSSSRSTFPARPIRYTRPPPPPPPPRTPAQIAWDAGVVWRRHVYERGLRAKLVGVSVRSKVRDVSPEFFKKYPDKILLLIPWIRREIEAILKSTSAVEQVKDYTVAILKKYEIQSDLSISLLTDFLGKHAELFVHELIAFARSPLTNISDYDAESQHGEAQSFPELVRAGVASSSSSAASGSNLAAYSGSNSETKGLESSSADSRDPGDEEDGDWDGGGWVRDDEEDMRYYSFNKRKGEGVCSNGTVGPSNATNMPSSLSEKLSVDIWERHRDDEREHGPSEDEELLSGRRKRKNSKKERKKSKRRKEIRPPI